MNSEISPMVTFIITMYNVEKYIGDLLENLDKIAEIEHVQIILVNDSSIDNTEKIAHEFINKYSKNKKAFKIYNIKHSGLSIARNFGKSLAQGEYIQFVDGDDVLDPNKYIKLISKLKNEMPDVVFFNWNVFYENGETFKEKALNTKDYKIKELSKNNVLKLLMARKVQSYVWGFVAKNSLWNNSKIEFPRNRAWEDYAVVYKLFDLANNFEYYDEEIIFYRRRNGSISSSNSVDDVKKNVKDIMQSSVEILAYFDKDSLFYVESREYVLSYLFLAYQMLNKYPRTSLNKDLKNMIVSIDKRKISLKFKLIIIFYKMNIYNFAKKFKDFFGVR